MSVDGFSSRGGGPPGIGDPVSLERLRSPWMVVPSALALLAAVGLLPWSEDTWHVIYPTLRFLGRNGFSGLFDYGERLPGLGALVTIMAVAWVYAPKAREAMVPLLVAIGISGAFSYGIKEVAGRSRPTYGVRLHESEGAQQFIRQWNAENPGAPLPMTATDKWLFGKDRRPWFEDGFASFPSGHTTTAFALAAWVSIAFPRIRYLGLGIAVLCGLARIEARRHWPEDILFGGALGWLTAVWVMRMDWPVLANRWLLEQLYGARDRGLGDSGLFRVWLARPDGTEARQGDAA